MSIPKARIFVALTIGLVSLVGMLALLALWGSEPPSVHAQSGTGIIRVATTGTDAPGCGGPGNPCQTVQYAVDQALPGDEVRVATGNYTGVTTRPAPADYNGPPASEVISQVVYISKTVTVRGGYTTVDWNNSDPDANPTTLDAQGQGRVLVIVGDVSPTVEGLRITGGDAAGLGGGPWDEDAGGGIYILGSTGTVSNCQVFSNTAQSGGGFYVEDSAATITAHSVTTNTAVATEWGSFGDGGGLFLNNSAVSVNGNSITANSAEFRDGSAVRDWERRYLRAVKEILRSAFTRNVSSVTLSRSEGSPPVSAKGRRSAQNDSDVRRHWVTIRKYLSPFHKPVNHPRIHGQRVIRGVQQHCHPGQQHCGGESDR